MSNQKVWFITGASKGLGLALAKLALSNGDKVVATSRSIKELEEQISQPDENFLPLKVDLTSDKDVRHAIERSIAYFGKLDVIVNNAGYSLVGSMEEMSDQEFRATLDVNLFGTVNVIRNVMPSLRTQNSGHIINISSNAGYVGFANATSYNAAKFAVVGLSEGLAQEVSAFGIKVTLVAPGQFRTSFMEKGSMMFAKNRIDVYGLDKAEETWSSFSGQQIGDPEKLVRILTEVAAMENPPVRLLLGPDTYHLLKEHREKEATEFELWKHLTLSTNFD
ncbi:short-chain dehydrogenase [Pedobacter antarcticus 4BY]|uniref:Short-chain dehydrogenase n=2 Tax=Pedobacter antarcticus TaxID=34086 RepID=A0A081PJU4_9SPHI|nr:SDR family NAD(P)-dependent oxidoreductase [Pedobacter antarcticus]KEQ30967.1 short-chain dehydrogenase [Pedobacter antarcticus 4BY]SFF21919.1 NADP-dependent 3-hydroxy acid dehydrogenase YdfG [Pedobacter antarcticus]